MANKTEGSPSEEHQKLVGYLIKWMKEEGYVIECASYGTNSLCDAVNGSIPDARGYRSSIALRCYGESETAETIDTEHTRTQFKTFADRVMRSGKSEGTHCPFYITIPEGSEKVLGKVLKELDLQNKSHIHWKSFQL